jgi:hypothetical protein
MKKTILAIAVMAMVSCNAVDTSNDSQATDSTSVDSVKVDSVAVDTVTTK